MLGGTPARRTVLMGRRGAAAAFMPGRLVFPGGAVDPGDADAAIGMAGPDGAGRLALAVRAETPAGPAIAAAAVRELFEETGLAVGAPGTWDGPAPPGWEGFAARGLRPSAAGLAFVFRAITPAGHTRRFDARFFRAEARVLGIDEMAGFAGASDELSDIGWRAVEDAEQEDLAFVTRLALAEALAPPHGDGVAFLEAGRPRQVLRLG